MSIITREEVITQAQLAARVPVGTIVRSTYRQGGAINGAEIVVRGRVYGYEGESLRVVNTFHGEDSWMVGKTQSWSARFCTIVRRAKG